MGYGPFDFGDKDQFLQEAKEAADEAFRRMIIARGEPFPTPEEIKAQIEKDRKEFEELEEKLRRTYCVIQVPKNYKNRKDFDIKKYFLECLRKHPERISYKEGIII